MRRLPVTIAQAQLWRAPVASAQDTVQTSWPTAATEIRTANIAISEALALPVMAMTILVLAHLNVDCLKEA